MNKIVSFVIVGLVLLGSVSAIGLLSGPSSLTVNTAQNQEVTLSVKGDSSVHDGVFFVKSNASGLNIEGSKIYEKSMSLGVYEQKDKQLTLEGVTSGSYLVSWGYRIPGSGAGGMDSVIEKSFRVTVVCTIDCGISGDGGGSSGGSSGGRGGGGSGSSGGGVATTSFTLTKVCDGKYVLQGTKWVCNGQMIDKNSSNSTTAALVAPVIPVVDASADAEVDVPAVIKDISQGVADLSQGMVPKEEGSPALAELESSVGGPNNAFFYALFAGCILVVLFTIYVIYLTKEAES